MKDEILTDFDAQWCQDLLTSPEYTVNPLSRAPPPPHNTAAPQYIFERALKTPTTIRAWRHLSSKATKPPAISPEQILLLSLGGDLTGHHEHLHGGVYGVVLDQVSGMCAYAEVGTRSVTQELTIKFRRTVRVPGLLLCRAAVARREGNRIWVRSTMHDGEGRLCGEGEAVFYVRKKENL